MKAGSGNKISSTSSARAARRRIDYKAIPQPSGGKICLSIYPPGTWFGRDGYHCFVGGCGIGVKDTLPEAEAFLFRGARETLNLRITQSKAQIEFYEAQLKLFQVLQKID